MKRHFLFAVLLSASTITYGQILKIDSNGVFINATQIKSIQDVVNALGLPERTVSKANKIWTYDSLGVKVYLEPVNSQLTYITLDFKKHDYGFSPKKLFAGELSIYGHAIDENTSVTDLKNIKELIFKENMIQVYSATTFSVRLSFEYFADVNKLEVVHIGF